MLVANANTEDVVTTGAGSHTFPLDSLMVFRNSLSFLKYIDTPPKIQKREELLRKLSTPNDKMIWKLLKEKEGYKSCLENWYPVDSNNDRHSNNG